MPEKYCVLVQPTYDAPRTESVEAFGAAGNRVLIDGETHQLLVKPERPRLSALPHNFNTGWCVALNIVHLGERVDYFAMLHADIAPEPGWLSKLIEEMEDKQLDVLSAVSPIKNNLGLTSTAIDNNERDTWRPMCRLTMKEVFDLPETFTEDDLPGPLLINTGCWVVKWNQDWCKQVHFEFNDRIVFNTALNRYMPEFEPEDWCISRMFNDLGLRVGATRKVRLAHYGDREYRNDHPWGNAHDSSYIGKSLISDQSIEFPYDVDGWLLPEEGRALAKLATGKDVLEIGSYCGKSTICLAKTARRVVSIDPHDGTGTPTPRNTWREFNANLVLHGVESKVVSQDREYLPRDSQFDLVFVDGAHDSLNVHQDIALARRVLREGGLIAFHDYRREDGDCDGRWDPAVTQAVDQLVDDGAELISRHATVAVVRPPALVTEFAQ